ncbi:MAG: TatD family hydrolase, partial [Elusimicrobia bacterium]|nr:TatD family hydrolase [Candidatus Obscuribacterium magneticum]
QKKTCRALIELALKVNKPIIIHCREAYPDLIDMLRSFFSTGRSDSCPGVIHCFSGDVHDAQELVRMGFYLGVDGPITYPNAHRLREALAPIPLDFIVLETDSPYLPLQSYRGKRNEPSYIPLMADYFASWRKVDLIDLSNVFMANSQRLFRLR